MPPATRERTAIDMVDTQIPEGIVRGTRLVIRGRRSIVVSELAETLPHVGIDVGGRHRRGAAVPLPGRELFAERAREVRVLRGDVVLLCRIGSQIVELEIIVLEARIRDQLPARRAYRVELASLVEPVAAIFEPGRITMRAREDDISARRVRAAHQRDEAATARRKTIR